jgi:hypothetical protein
MHTLGAYPAGESITMAPRQAVPGAQASSCSYKPLGRLDSNSMIPTAARSNRPGKKSPPAWETGDELDEDLGLWIFGDPDTGAFIVGPLEVYLGICRRAEGRCHLCDGRRGE